MKHKTSYFLLLLLTALLSACGGQPTESLTWLPATPDYARSTAWFGGGHAGEHAYNVFYIVPTCVFDWADPTGATCHYMDIDNEQHRAAVDGPLRLAQGLFAEEAGFFAPYYRQITIESWMESANTIDSRFELAYEDIRSAFHYFLDSLNNGHPFVLAGHSQGGKAVIELLKREMDAETYSLLIAAYPLGYPVRDTDVSPYIVPATDAAGTGVCITFNSVSEPYHLPPLLHGSRMAINPLNWRTDSTQATEADHLGAVFLAPDGSIASVQTHILSAHLDEVSKSLVVSGIDPEAYYVPSLAGLFRPGNYHVVELNLFYLNLQANVKLRAANFYNTSGYSKTKLEYMK